LAPFQLSPAKWIISNIFQLLRHFVTIRKARGKVSCAAINAIYHRNERVPFYLLDLAISPWSRSLILSFFSSAIRYFRARLTVQEYKWPISPAGAKREERKEHQQNETAPFLSTFQLTRHVKNSLFFFFIYPPVSISKTNHYLTVLILAFASTWHILHLIW